MRMQLAFKHKPIQAQKHSNMFNIALEWNHVKYLFS